MEKQFLLQGLREGWLIQTERGSKYALTNEDDLFGKFLKEKFIDFVAELKTIEAIGEKRFAISFVAVSSDSWEDLAKKKTREIKGKNLG